MARCELLPDHDTIAIRPPGRIYGSCILFMGSEVHAGRWSDCSRSRPAIGARISPISAWAMPRAFPRTTSGSRS